MFKSFKKFMFLVFLASFIAIIVIFLPRFEMNKPQISFSKDITHIGLKPFSINVSDEGQGLRKVSVYLKRENDKTLLVEKSYKRGVKSDDIDIKIDLKNFDIKKGKAELEVNAEDYSRSKVFSGNKNQLLKEVNIDLVAPAAAEVSSTQYLNHGGSGFIVYKVSNDVVRSGVKIKDYFFRGYGGYFENPDIHICFYAYPYDLGSDEDIYLYVEDAAGNTGTQGVNYSLKNVNYRQRDIDVDEDFINSKMLPLVINEGIQDESPREIFLQVNNRMRKENNSRISELTQNTSNEILWDGSFLQLSNSKVEANFADYRTYIVGDEPVDKQYHLGFDLSVTKNYPIEAANRGVVVYADNLGIYGNTVILDHGMGVMSLYSHMSSIDVKEGQEVEKKEIIGRTGVTGLAGGDHLHFGMYVHGVAVRPIEWWDKKWINEKILDRIEAAKLSHGS